MDTNMPCLRRPHRASSRRIHRSIIPLCTSTASLAGSISPGACCPRPSTSSTRSLSAPAFWPSRRRISTSFSASASAGSNVRQQQASRRYRLTAERLLLPDVAGVQTLSPDGRTPTEQLSLIRRAVVPFYATMGRVWRDAIHPALREIGIVIRSYHELSVDERNECDVYFRDSIFPILTPLAVDPGHPFPFISNLSLSLAVQLRHPTRGTEHFARLKVPTRRGRWLQLKHSGQYVPIEQIIAANAHELFRGMIVESVHPFRISRNADVSRSEEEADDLLEMISEELRERRFAPAVHLEADVGMPEPG